MTLAPEALGCSPRSPMAPDNPERVYSLVEAFNSPNLLQTRLAMLQDQPVKSCEYCYLREARGGISYRQTMNSLFRDRADWNALIADTQADGTLDHKPIYLDLRLGNQCNLRCVMCCYPVSSSWKQHVESTWLSGALDVYGDDDRFWEEVRELLPGLQRIYFAGGEPMLQSSHHRLLDLMIDLGFAGGIDVVYNTNLTYLPPGILDKFQGFKSVEIGASCDGMGATFEKIRRGARWDDFERNLRRVAPHVRLRLAVTPQRDNVDNLPQLVEWALREGYEIDLANILQYPEELSLAALSAPARLQHATEYERLAAHCRSVGETRLAREIDAIHHILASQ
jgi:pyruvate-formate lyase-activating enzyme